MNVLDNTRVIGIYARPWFYFFFIRHLNINQFPTDRKINKKFNPLFSFSMFLCYMIDSDLIKGYSSRHFKYLTIINLIASTSFPKPCCLHFATDL